ncbi:hypothetical protein KGQ34_04610 [Patescibacteria group bacterium]|nr:hypothetical protein [Patescibacteria group bacterium]
MEEERIDAPFGVDVYVLIPVKNHAAPSADQLAFGVAATEKLVALDKKIYVHRKNGHDRAPTLIATYLVAKAKAPKKPNRLLRQGALPKMRCKRTALQNFSAYAAPILHTPKRN